MSVEAIGSGIKTNLSNITSLSRVYAPNEMPNQINEFPCAVIQHVGTEYGLTMGGALDKHDFRIVVFITNQDTPSAFNRLLDFLASTGDDSIVQAIRDDITLNGSASDVTIIDNTGQSIITWAGVQYLGTEFNLEVYE